MSDPIPRIEKKIFAFAFAGCLFLMGLIAYAAFKLGIGVPGCVPSNDALMKPDFITHSDRQYEVHFSAYMWNFQPNHIELPTGSTLDIYLTSKDVVHGFYIKNTNVNLMAVPGVLANEKVTFSKPGTYEIFCHEYCGSAHHNMMAVIEVKDNIQTAKAAGLPQDALATAANSADGSVLSEAAQKGMKLATEKGCMACHSVDGTRVVGPSFKGIYMKQEALTDGSTITVDDAYLKESIKDPDAKVAQGYNKGLMPKLPLSEEEINLVIEWIKTVK